MSDIKDLSYGKDYRGDYALFIDEKHFIEDWKVDKEAVETFDYNDVVFFRLISESKQRGSHGWVDGKGDILQWGKTI